MNKCDIIAYMKRIKLLIVIFIVIFALSGCSNRTNVSQEQALSSSTTESTASFGTLIQIMHDQFKPDKITIKIGTTITWVNYDSAAHWIISDPHPTHNILPELNSKKELQQKEVYQFKFDRAGTFYYHDELNTSLGGTVIVEK